MAETKRAAVPLNMNIAVIYDNQVREDRSAVRRREL